MLTSKELVEKKRALELRQCVKRKREHAKSLISFAASEPARLSRRKRVPPEAYEAVSDPKVHVAYKELRATLAMQSRLSIDMHMHLTVREGGGRELHERGLCFTTRFTRPKKYSVHVTNFEPIESVD